MTLNDEDMKNYGFNETREIAEQTPTDYLAGRITPLFEIPLDERERYLPKGEVQKGREDFMDCVTRFALNQLAAYFTYGLRNQKFSQENINWLIAKGYAPLGKFGVVDFSDRFIAMLSNTTRNGNSFKAVLQAVHEHGLIPKEMLLARSDMTFDDYHNKNDITEDMRALGCEFLARFSIQYERVYDIEKALERDLVGTGVYAWPSPENGVYQRVEYPFNHAITVFKPKYHIFDNYTEGPEDYIKELAPDYKFFQYGYVIVPTAEYTPEKKTENWLIQLMNKLFLLQKLLDQLKKMRGLLPT